MAMHMRPRGDDNQGGFGKRGHVTLSPQPDAPAQSSDAGLLKWIGGGLAAAALLALITGGTGGGGLLGGLIGGLLGAKLAKSMAGAPAPAPTTAPSSTAKAPAPMAPVASVPAPAAAPQATTVQRGGFGTTASSSAGSGISSGS